MAERTPLSHHDHVKLPWADSIWPWKRCRARREHKKWQRHFGRCELQKDHKGDHALERGFDTPRWSTEWSDY